MKIYIMKFIRKDLLISIKYMFKRIFYIFMIITLISNTIAVNSNYERKDWNCNKWNIDYYYSLLVKWNLFQNNIVITKDVFEKAVENLEKYCNNEDNVLQTSIFANHLYDVSMRKLDWIKWAAYWVKLDDLWKQWREYLNDIEKEADTDPKKIAKEFQKVWWDADKNVDSNPNTLYWRYKKACDELHSLSDKLLSTNSKDDNLYSMWNWYMQDICYTEVSRRYLKETQMISQLEMHNLYNHAEKQLYKSINEDFTKEISKVFNEFAVLLWQFEYVVRRYIHWSDVNTR